MRSRCFSLVVLVVVLAACGSDPDAGLSDTTTGSEGEVSAADASTTTVETPTTTEEVTTTETTQASTTQASPAVDPDLIGAELVGRWAHFDVVAYEDAAFKTMIVSYGFNNFDVEDGEIIDTAEFCFSEQVSNQPFESALSDAGTQAIKPPATPLEVEEVDGEIRIYRPPTPTPVGIRLDDPANESLPDDPQDPRVIDDDGDGKPGVTVTIDAGGITGELYIARREIFSYEAALTSQEPDAITGVVTDMSEQLVIGASSDLFLGQESNFVQHANLEKSPIILQRVEADWDCDRLRTERDSLFPPTPVVDW